MTYNVHDSIIETTKNFRPPQNVWRQLGTTLRQAQLVIANVWSLNEEVDCGESQTIAV